MALPETVVQSSSRGQSIRALQIVPSVPVLGSVILLAGGNGRLDLDASGVIHTSLSGNQLVRTRQLYAQAGFITLVPDLAPDLKVGTGGVVPNYRVGKDHAHDVGAMTLHLRTLGPSLKVPSPMPVVVIGTSTGSIAAANAIARLRAPGELPRPDAMAITSAYLVPQGGHLSVEGAAEHHPGTLDVPTLVMAHADDACADTPPWAIPAFAKWYRANDRTLAVSILSGGGPFTGDPCQANHAHGFAGLDNLVALTITTWIAQEVLAA